MLLRARRHPLFSFMLSLAGIISAVASVFLPLPMGIMGVLFGLLGMATAERKALGWTAVVLSVMGTAAGFLFGAVLTR